jgi:hypothetical protein
MFSAATIGLGGAIYAVSLRHHGAQPWAIRAVDLLMIVIVLAGAVLAGRVRPAAVPG